MHELVLTNIHKTYKSTEGLRVVLDGIDLVIPTGQLVVILGPSGCGKTTLLKIIAGLIKPDEGNYCLTINDYPITKPGPERNIVFQNYTSFPWLTALENVRFGLQFMKLSKVEQYQRAEAYLKQVGLFEFRNEYPKNLSGGQQQRVAIARTLAAEPDIILMDEPFASLDAQTRDIMQSDLVDIWKKTGQTILFVTHDILEAAFLGEKVLILKRTPAKIIQDFNTTEELEQKIIKRLKASNNQTRIKEIEDITGVSVDEISIHHRGDWVRLTPEFLEFAQKLKKTIINGRINN